MKKKLTIIAACAAMLITLGISVLTWTESKSNSPGHTNFDNNKESNRNNESNGSPGTSVKKDFIITIDPGHGGYDPGKIGVNNIQEKDVNLAISLILRDILTDSDRKSVGRERV